MVKIADLTNDMKEVTIEVEVVDIPKYNTITTRFGNEVYVVDITVKDDTGKIQLTLWNEDINKVNRVGSWFVIENGFTNSFHGEVKLNVGRQGKLIELCNEPCAPDFKIACESPKETCNEHMHDIMEEKSQLEK